MNDPWRQRAKTAPKAELERGHPPFDCKSLQMVDADALLPSREY